MKVTKKTVDAQDLELTVKIEATDYSEVYRKRFAECRRKADFKGFRKGMVPASLIQRVYGDQLLGESVNEVVSKALTDYIETEGLKVLGEPLPSEKQPEVEWKEGNDFTFVYDVALSPEVNLDITAEDSVNQYTITVTAKDKAPMVESMKKYYEEHKEEGKEAKTDEEIDEEVTGRMKEQYRQEAEWRLSKDIRDYCVEKAGLTLPEDFLKRWLFVANDGKFTKEDIEKDFPGFAADFKWQLVRGYLMKKYDFKISQEDITSAAQAYVTYQYAMYGMANLPAELLTEAVNNVLKDPKQIDSLVERVEDEKVLGKLKETMTLKAKKISAEKFREL